jgi:hypothetical protein
MLVAEALVAITQYSVWLEEQGAGAKVAMALVALLVKTEPLTQVEAVAVVGQTVQELLGAQVAQAAQAS